MDKYEDLIEQYVEKLMKVFLLHGTRWGRGAYGNY